MIESRSSGGRCGGGAVFATQSAEARVSGTSAAFTEPRLVCGWPYNGSRCGVRAWAEHCGNHQDFNRYQGAAPRPAPPPAGVSKPGVITLVSAHTSSKHLTSCSVKSTIPSNRSVLADTVPATTCKKWKILQYLPISLPIED